MLEERERRAAFKTFSVCERHCVLFGFEMNVLGTLAVEDTQLKSGKCHCRRQQQLLKKQMQKGLGH